MAATALAAGTVLKASTSMATETGNGRPADLILTNGRVATLRGEKGPGFVQALAVGDGRILAAGTNGEIEALANEATVRIDAAGKTVIPGLNDSHTHVIRGGLNYNMELRWENVSSLGEALEMIRAQAAITPPPQWVRVIGGWSEFQFRERRMPTLQEINEAAPDTPVFILHLYSSAILNQAAIRALGYDVNPPAFDRGVIVRDERGKPTGMLVAKPSAAILYQSIAAAPRLSTEDQAISTRHFMRELNSLGVTSVIDAGGGGQNYPEDYEIIRRLNEAGHLTLRIGYNLFAQKAGSELEDYRRWTGMTGPGEGDDMLRTIGAGENLTWSAADFENFLEPRPDLAERMEGELEGIVRLLAEARWPFRIHATYDESIDRFLSVFERVNREVPFDGFHWFIDHAETISDRSIDRVRALGGGIAIQHRMAFQGEYFLDRYGREAIKRTPPVRRMLQTGVPVGAGTDATRVASYDPWVCLYWLTTGRTLGGLAMYDDDNKLERDEALRLWTRGSSWFSDEEAAKGSLEPGRYADFAILDKDFFSCPDEEIKAVRAALTVVNGKVVYAKDSFKSHDPRPLPVSPGWSPIPIFRGASARHVMHSATHQCQSHHGTHACTHHTHDRYGAALANRISEQLSSIWSPGCSCFAF